MAVTGLKTPTNVVGLDTGSGGSVWAGTGNLALSDNLYSTSTLPVSGKSQTLRATGFGFTTADIPAGSRIDGIEFFTERKATSSGRVSDAVIRFVLHNTGTAADRFGGDQSKSVFYTTSDTQGNYGGVAYAWGALIYEAQIMDPNFGVDIVVQTNSVGTATASLDQLRMRVTYTPATADVKGLASIATTLGQTVAALRLDHLGHIQIAAVLAPPVAAFDLIAQLPVFSVFDHAHQRLTLEHETRRVVIERENRNIKVDAETRNVRTDKEVRTINTFSESRRVSVE